MTAISPPEEVGSWPPAASICLVASCVQSRAPDCFVLPHPEAAPRLKTVVSRSKGLTLLPSRGVVGSTPKGWPVTIVKVNDQEERMVPPLAPFISSIMICPRASAEKAKKTAYLGNCIAPGEKKNFIEIVW